MDEAKLLARVHQDELVELTQQLVRIDSVIRPETGNTEAGVVEFLRSWVQRELGLEPTVESVEPGRENLFFTLDSGRPGPCLLLEGHTDVVSEGERGRWSVEPFGGELKEGRIYGRGACDMKAGLAVNLVVAKALVSSGVAWRGRLALCFVCDEEGMMIGIKDCIHLPAYIDAIVKGDPAFPVYKKPEDPAAPFLPVFQVHKLHSCLIKDRHDKGGNLFCYSFILRHNKHLKKKWAHAHFLYPRMLIHLSF